MIFPVNPISFIKDYGKIIAAATISVILIYFLTMMTIYKSRYETQKTLAETRLKTVTEQNQQIIEYKKNIELAKQHEQRVVHIRQKGAKVHQSIVNMKSRELTNEEKDIAVVIGDRINRMQSDRNDSSKTGGKILPGTSGDISDSTKNNP
jgi:ABC-type uncharacterized transport system involved in gliding motility auxiliary subunit